MAADDSRRERATVAVTPQQSRAISGVAALRGLSRSELLHRFSVQEIEDMWEPVQRAFDKRGAA